MSLSLQLFIPCVYGSILISESDKLGNAVYGCNWMDQSQKFKRSLTIIQQRTIKLLVPTTYKDTFVVGLETFVNVWFFNRTEMTNQ